MLVPVSRLLARLGLLALLAGPLAGIAQSTSPVALPARRVVEDPTLHPQFPGGERALRSYIARSIQYPLEAYRQHVIGKVQIRYIVDETGRVQEPTVKKSLGFGCDEEALRIIQALPAFTPGLDAAGQAVAVYEYSVVEFLLEEKSYRPGAPSPLAGSAAPLAPLFPRLNDLGVEHQPAMPPAIPLLAGAGTLAAQYPGGLSELFVFISRHTRYPKFARKAKVRGRVLVSVLVDEHGRATNPTVAQSLSYDCDLEALRVVSLIPYRFNPAQSDAGQPVASRVEVPVFFPRTKLGKYRQSSKRSVEWWKKYGNPWVPIPL